MFSCEFYEIFQNSFSLEHLSVLLQMLSTRMLKTSYQVVTTQEKLFFLQKIRLMKLLFIGSISSNKSFYIGYYLYRTSLVCTAFSAVTVTKGISRNSYLSGRGKTDKFYFWHDKNKK